MLATNGLQAHGGLERLLKADFCGNEAPKAHLKKRNKLGHMQLDVLKAKRLGYCWTDSMNALTIPKLSATDTVIFKTVIYGCVCSTNCVSIKRQKRILQR